MSYKYTFLVSGEKIMVSTVTMQVKPLQRYFTIMMVPFVLQNFSKSDMRFVFLLSDTIAKSTLKYTKSLQCQESGLCNISYARYLEKRFTEIYKVLFRDAMLVSLSGAQIRPPETNRNICF